MAIPRSTLRGQAAADALQGPSLAAPAAILVLLVTIAPMVMLLVNSFRTTQPGMLTGTGFTFHNYARFFFDPYYLNIFATTVWVSALCTALSLLLGFPVAWFLARYRGHRKSLLIILLVFPLVVGNVVRAEGWMVILGNAGVINATLRSMGLITEPLRLLYTPAAVVIGTTGVVLPYFILTLQSVLEGIDFSIEEAAHNLGANFPARFFRVILPLCAPGVAAGTVLVFILCMNAYATPVLLGGTGITMMAPALYDQITKASDWAFGSALAWVLVVATLIIAVFTHWFINRRYVRAMAA